MSLSFRYLPFDPPARDTPKKLRLITMPHGLHKELVHPPVPAAHWFERKARPKIRMPANGYDLENEAIEFLDPPVGLEEIPPLFANPYWRVRVGRSLEHTFGSAEPTLADSGYVQQASELVLTNLRRGLGRESVHHEEDKENESGPSTNEPEFAVNDAVEEAFKNYWEKTEKLPEYERQIEVIRKMGDPEFYDWYMLSLDEMRRSLFIAGNSVVYLTRPRLPILVQVLREAAKDEFPVDDWSYKVGRDARFLRALWRLARVNYSLLAVAGETGAVIGSIVAWYPADLPPYSTEIPDWESLTRKVRERLIETEEGRRALVEVERLAAEDERLSERARNANRKDPRAMQLAGDEEVPFVQHVWVNPRVRPMAIDLSLVYSFNTVVTKGNRAAFFIGKIDGESTDFPDSADVRTVEDGESPILRRIEIIDFGPDYRHLRVFGQRIAEPDTVFAETDGKRGDELRAMETELIFSRILGPLGTRLSRYAWANEYIDEAFIQQLEGEDDDEEDDYDALEAAIAKQPAPKDDDDY